MLPNYLTFLRLLLLPVFAALFLMTAQWALPAALGVFVVASITDFLDGYIARRFNLHSDLGRVLDPIADKLLVVTALICLVFIGEIAGIHIIAALLITGREIYIAGLREYMIEKRISIPVSKLGKGKTALQMVALFCLLAAAAGFMPGELHLTGLVFLWLSTLLTILSAVDYSRQALAHIRQGA